MHAFAGGLLCIVRNAIKSAKLAARTSRNRASKTEVQTLFSVLDKYRGDLSSTEGEQLNGARVQSDFRETVTESTTAKSHTSPCVSMRCNYMHAR